MKWLIGLLFVAVAIIGGLIVAALIAIKIASKVFKNEEDSH